MQRSALHFLPAVRHSAAFVVLSCSAADPSGGNSEPLADGGFRYPGSGGATQMGTGSAAGANPGAAGGTVGAGGLGAGALPGTAGGAGGSGGSLGAGGSGGIGGSNAGGGGASGAGAGGVAGGGGGGTAGGGAGGASTTCPTSTLKAGDSTATLTHAGTSRTYLVHVPTSYNGSRAVPLVLDIHGLTSSAAAQKGLSGWVAKADKEGFIVIHPEGLNASWNGGDLCCGTSQSTKVDDVGFMRAIVKKTSGEACIDQRRVYATGLSNGGAMSHRLACEAADLFAATAPVSMGNGTRPCAPSRPISVTMFRGTSDTLVSYNGGIFPSAQADFDQWKGLSKCTGTTETTHGLCKKYSNCGGGTEVTLCTINAGHVLYSAAVQQQAPVPDVVWEMFSRQTLP